MASLFLTASCPQDPQWIPAGLNMAMPWHPHQQGPGSTALHPTSAKEHQAEVLTSPSPLATHYKLPSALPVRQKGGRHCWYLQPFPWEQAQPFPAAVSSGLCEQDLTQREQLMCSKPASCQACCVMHLELHRCSQAERPYFFSPLYLGKSLSNERCGERSSWWLNGSGFCHRELIEMLGWIFCPHHAPGQLKYKLSPACHEVLWKRSRRFQGEITFKGYV